MTPQDTAIDLEDAGQSGVYLVTAEDQAAVASAETPGTCVRGIDLAGCAGKRELLDRVAAALAFPAGFGHNWDALSDCLRDLSWLPAQGYALLFEHAAALHEGAPRDFDVLLDILDEAAAAWSEAGIPFFAFVGLPDAAFAEGDAAGTDVRETDFALQGEFVELNQLLKLVGLVDSGGAGKALVASGAVRVDGAVELRKTCKIRPGQQVEAEGLRIRVLPS